MTLRFNLASQVLEVDSSEEVYCRHCRKKLMGGYYCSDTKTVIHRACMVCRKRTHTKDCDCGREDPDRHMRHISPKLVEHTEYVISRVNVKRNKERKE